MTINSILLVSLLLVAIWTVMTIRLIRSIVGLALTSALLSVIMYRLDAPLAAVFELSVCAGLISVIFITTVSFTQRVSRERLLARRKERLKKLFYLPFIIIVAAFFLAHYLKLPPLDLGAVTKNPEARVLLWNLRHLDLLGQVIVLLAGVFGVVVLFKEDRS